MKEESKRRARESLNEIEEKLFSEFLDAYKAGLPDFWDILEGLERLLRVENALSSGELPR